MGGSAPQLGCAFYWEREWMRSPAGQGAEEGGVQDPAELEAWRKNKEGLRLEREVGAHSSGRRAWAPRRSVCTARFERGSDADPVSLSPLVLGIPVQGPNGLGPLWTVRASEAAAEESSGEKGGVAGVTGTESLHPAVPPKAPSGTGKPLDEIGLQPPRACAHCLSKFNTTSSWASAFSWAVRLRED